MTGVHVPFEFDCIECGQHIVDLAGIRREPPICATCLALPEWFKDEKLKRIFGFQKRED